jgi:multicomponent Na+:H+ antiporter subunit G
MIEWAVEAILYILLIAAIGFGGISVIGLLIFPDIRSRTFTGLRAGIIALALVSAAGIWYGIFLWVTTGGMQYLLFALAAILMLVLVVVANRIAADTVCRKAVLALSSSKEQEDNS